MCLATLFFFLCAFHCPVSTNIAIDTEIAFRRLVDCTFMKLCVTPQLKPQFFFHLSALDAESEHLVQEALERLMKGRTVITIAHRLSTIKNADNIVVLSDGQISEAGSYMELMAEPDGLFRKLVEEMAYCCWYERGPYWFFTGGLTLPSPSPREGRRS